jgi:hypothetical protein
MLDQDHNASQNSLEEDQHAFHQDPTARISKELLMMIRARIQESYK